MNIFRRQRYNKKTETNDLHQKNMIIFHNRGRKQPKSITWKVCFFHFFCFFFVNGSWGAVFKCYLNAIDETARTLTDSSRGTEILRKDTTAGKRAFSFFSVYSCNFSLFQFTAYFFACKGTIRREGGLGNRGGSVGIKTRTGKWRTICAPDKIRCNGHTFWTRILFGANWRR